MPENRSIDTLFIRSLLLLLLLFHATHLMAEVEATLTPQNTSLDQPVRLTLQIEGEQELSPDLSVLEKDFEILGRSTQQSISVINGQMSAKRSLILTLLPNRAGRLTIPPIPVGDEQTRPLTLQVSEQPQEATGENQKQVQIELSLNKQSAYLDEEVLLTLKLYQAPGIRGESLELPETTIDDLQMELIHEDYYSSQKEGTEYRVLERVYALFPQQTGTLTLSKAKFRGHSGGSRDPFLSLFRDPFPSQQQSKRIIRSESNSVSIEILPIPEAFTGDRWLPAKNLQIVESGIDNSAMALAGKPLTRRVMVIADGVTSSRLPSLEQEMPAGIKRYPEQPHLNNKPSRSGISSTLQQSFTLIATEAGHYELPALEIPWWNTETQQQEIARLPAREITFTANPSATPAPANQAPTVERQLNDDQSAEPTDSNGSENEFPWLTTLLGIAWLLTLGAWWKSSRNKSTEKRPETPRPNQPGSGQEALQEIVERLKTAYQTEEHLAARSAWLDWGQLKWPDNPPNNLARLAKRCHPELAMAVNALERAIYSPTAQSDWSRYEIMALIEKPNSATTEAKSKTSMLVPLNP
jgi:hypothetical protein